MKKLIFVAILIALFYYGVIGVDGRKAGQLLGDGLDKAQKALKNVTQEVTI
jgi:hypothetical protein